MEPIWSIIKDGIVGNWGIIIVFVLPFVLPNKVVRSAGYALGSVLTTFLRQRIGKSGEEVEKWFQGTLSAFMGGLNDGLDKDDT